MTSIQSTHTSPSPRDAAAVPPALVLLLAASAGFAVASLYYSQPMLALIGADLHVSAATIGLVPTLTQLGYALGILVLAPLGDRYDRRRIILWKSVALAAALLVAGVAPTITPLLGASLAIGLAATMAQDIVPAAATLAPEAHRGKIVGNVMTGLLLGILLSRVVSGAVAQHQGWRTVFVGAAVSLVLAGVALRARLPRFAPTTSLGYGALLGSLVQLWRRHPELRRATLAQALLAVGFSAFWSTLAVHLAGAPFHLGSDAAGAYGLAGAAGALAAPLAGRRADRHGPGGVTRLGAGLAVLAFAALLAGPLLSTHGRLWLLAGSAVVFDFGIQATLVAHQTIVYQLEPPARSRLNALLFVGMFVGMAAGAALGTLLLARAGLTGVAALASLAALAALVIRSVPAGQRPEGLRAGT